MLKLTALDFLLRIIPESLLAILLAYVLTHKNFEKTPFLVSSMIYAISIFLVRLFPISFGVHTLILSIPFIASCVLINKMPIIKVISSFLIFIVVNTFCETINLFLLINILKLDMQTILGNPLMRILYFMPSLALFGGTVFSLQMYKKTRRRTE